MFHCLKYWFQIFHFPFTICTTISFTHHNTMGKLEAHFKNLIHYRWVANVNYWLWLYRPMSIDVDHEKHHWNLALYLTFNKILLWYINFVTICILHPDIYMYVCYLRFWVRLDIYWKRVVRFSWWCHIHHMSSHLLDVLYWFAAWLLMDAMTNQHSESSVPVRYPSLACMYLNHFITQVKNQNRKKNCWHKNLYINERYFA